MEFRHDQPGKPKAKYLYGIKEQPQHTDLAGKDLSSDLREIINFVGFNFQGCENAIVLAGGKESLQGQHCPQASLGFLAVVAV